MVARNNDPILIGNPNTLLRIDELYAFVSKDDAGNEGVCGAVIGGVFTALVGADRARIDSLRNTAKQIAEVSGMKITLCRFSTRTELEEIS